MLRDENLLNQLREIVTQNNAQELEELLIENPKLVNITLNPEKEKIVHWAARVNAVNVMRVLINKNAKIDGIDNNKNTPLHIAALNTADQCCAILLDNQASVKARNQYGHTPLHLAASKNATNVVRLLIAANAQVNAVDHFKNIPLHLAAHSKAIESGRVLIEHNSKVNELNEAGYTPLHEAVLNYSPEFVHFLITHRAEIDVHQQYKSTILHLAVVDNKWELLEYFMRNHQDSVRTIINTNDLLQQTPLHIAARLNATESAILLITNGAIVNPKNELDKTPLQLAVSNNAFETAKVLIEQGAWLNHRDENYCTALQLTAENDSKEIAKLLIAARASTDIIDENQKTLLHLYVENDANGCAEVLIAAQPNLLNQADANGVSPLSKALELRSIDCAKLLIEKEADLNQENQNGICPSQFLANDARLSGLLKNKIIHDVVQKHEENSQTTKNINIVRLWQNRELNEQNLRNKFSFLHSDLCTPERKCLEKLAYSIAVNNSTAKELFDQFLAEAETKIERFISQNIHQQDESSDSASSSDLNDFLSSSSEIDDFENSSVSDFEMH